MKAIHAILLVGGLLVAIGGCATAPSGQATGDVHLPVSKVAGRPMLEAQGFAVLDFRVRRDVYDRVSVIGEIKNTGSLARCVELQATLRDADGRVAAVGHFYPASYTNIQPGDTWPFAHSFGRHDDAAKAELRIIGAVRSMDVLNVAYEMRE